MQPTQRITTPDGRSLDLWLAGPADGQPLIFHSGSPGAGLPFGWHVRALADLWQGAHDRMVPFGHGQWLAAHVGNACPHLLQEHGHLTLGVDAFPQILDELIA